MEYGIRAALASNRLEKVICSSDHDAILKCAKDLGAGADLRPEKLSGDEIPVGEVALDFLNRHRPSIPDVLVLVQPTSPFLLPEHVSQLLDALENDPEAQSCHNITPVSHNSHAWNQREEVNGRARFLYREERNTAYNKQMKPSLYTFGNLIAVRTRALLETGSFYTEPCAVVEIERSYAYDVDQPEDIPIAEALLKSACVSLPHVPIRFFSQEI